MKKDKEPANLIEEGTIFGDILLGDFDDSFQNLSMKEHLFLDFDKVSKAFNLHHQKKASSSNSDHNKIIKIFSYQIGTYQKSKSC